MIQRSQTSMERGIKKVRKARTIVMVMLVAVAVAIILIDRREQQSSTENYMIPQVNTAALPVTTEQIVDNSNRPLVPSQIIQQPVTVQSPRLVPEILSPVQENPITVVTPRNEVINNGTVKDTGRDRMVTVAPDVKNNKRPEVIDSKTEVKAEGIHIVKRNETLSSIAKHYYGKSSLWKLILNANQLKTENLSTGQKLIVPKVEKKVDGGKVEMAKNKSEKSTKSGMTAKHEEEQSMVAGEYRKGKMYTIKKGESLCQIAKHAHVGFLELYEVNKKILKNPHSIKPGLKIWIPDTNNMASPNK